MPLEGQWERQHTPLRRLSRRERRVVVPIALLILLACAAAVLYTAFGRDSSGPGAGCVEVTAAGSLGGATIHACGRAAARLCDAEAARDSVFARAVQERCHGAGYGRR